MQKKKKNKRSLNVIGKRKYDFDITLEKQIYSCLCCSYGAKKAFKKLDNEFKFNSYQQWKQYICNKYEHYSREDLIEFSRYLNQKIRDIKPIYEIWDLFFPVILTVIMTYGIDKLFKFEFSGLPFLTFLIMKLFLIIIFVIPLLLLIRQILLPMFDNSLEENFLHDCKEIIDEIIDK